MLHGEYNVLKFVNETWKFYHKSYSWVILQTLNYKVDKKLFWNNIREWKLNQFLTGALEVMLGRKNALHLLLLFTNLFLINSKLSLGHHQGTLIVPETPRQKLKFLLLFVY